MEVAAQLGHSVGKDYAITERYAFYSPGYLSKAVEALDALIATTDPEAPWPGDAAEGQRGRAGSPRQVALPEGWLDSQELNDSARQAVAQAELSVSGG